ncbi:short-chain dehydrogenase/reductase SDR [Caballeronia calidae]|uniref:Short-chain dehydrogenase/reductase SDR n=1 Tax=Caballeronia calidae TaxID=1777139 RepID=A0A158E5I0_9BURK|nr:SDR family oxidoreductase [Caballeronia calidae]SAL01696.1 short-chain dehydrogenase/reductase SDR [Caballeronia calidae]
MNLKDKVVIVTGAGRGIGKAASVLFAREGAIVCGVDWKMELLAETESAVRDAIPDAAFHSYQCDIRDEDQVKTTVAAVLDKCGTIDGLYNNAAVNTRSGSCVDMEMRSFDFTMAVNLRGSVLLCRHVIPHMVAQGKGSIVNTSSINAHFGGMGCDAYSISKAAIETLSKQLAYTYGSYGVRCNTICPGVIRTEGTLSAATDPEAAEQRLIGLSGPLGRPGKPQEIANLAAYLLSDYSSLVTGVTVFADGGFSTGGRKLS